MLRKAAIQAAQEEGGEGAAAWEEPLTHAEMGMGEIWVTRAP